MRAAPSRELHSGQRLVRIPPLTPGKRLARAASSEGQEEKAGRKAASSFAPPDIPTSSVRCAPDAAYSAAGFEVWAAASLGPGGHGGRRGGRLRQEPARQPHALCPDPRAA